MNQAAPHNSQVQIRPTRSLHDCVLLFCCLALLSSIFHPKLVAQTSAEGSSVDHSKSAAPSIAEYRALLQLHPDNPQYVSELAAALHRHGEPNAAISELQGFLHLHPATNSVRLELARYLGYVKKFPESLDQYSEVLRRDPNNFVAQVGVAKVLSWEGDLNASLRAYDKILERSPYLYDACVGKGYTLLWMGQKEQAYALLQSAARTHPEDEEVAQTVAGLRAELGATHRQSIKTRSEVEANHLEASALRNPLRSHDRAVIPKHNRNYDGPAAQGAVNSFPEPIAPARTALPQEHSPYWLVFLVATILVASISILITLSRNRVRNGRSFPKHAPKLPVSTNRRTPVQPEIVEPNSHDAVKVEPSRQIPLQPNAQINYALEGAQSQTVAHSFPDQGEVHPATGPETGLHGCVLLVDSNPAVLNFESMVLRSAGAEVMIAETGYAASKLLEEKHIDAVVIDCQPSGGISWRDLQSWIAEKKPELARKIILTCNSGNSEIQQLKLQTGLECLAKPLGIPELIRVAKSILKPMSYSQNDSCHQPPEDAAKVAGLGRVANQSR